MSNQTEGIIITLRPTLKQHQVYEALKVKDEVFFGGGAGGGKAQPLDSLILTRNGFVKMGELKLGDKVLTPKNKEATIIQIHPQGVKDIYEIEFIDGAKIKCTDEHLFDCWISGKKKSRKIRSLKELLDIKKNIIIPLSDKLEFGNNYKEADCYTIGVLLGDGGLSKSYITLTTDDIEIFDYLDFQGSEIRKKRKFQYSIVGGIFDEKLKRKIRFSEKLKKLGIISVKCENRFIPNEIKFGSLNNRLSVLQGLMDTDGYIDSRGHCSFCSKSKQLATDVQFVVRSLGGKATLKEVKKYCFYKGIKKEGIYYNVYINIKDCSNLFKLKRKKIRAKKYNGGFSELGRRIKSIKLVNKEIAQCISLDDNIGLYISNDFIITHNSWIICESRLINAIRFPGYRSFIGREELKRLMQSTYITWTKVCQHHKIPQGMWKLNGQYNFIEFTNGSRIDLLDLKFIPSDPLYERFGSTEYTDGAIEEAGEVHPLAYEVLKSRIGRHKNKEFDLNATLLITGNPKKNWTYKEFYKRWKDGYLEDNKAFIQSLYKDNPYTAEEYGKQLGQIKDKIMRMRLKEGVWEYDADPCVLIKYDHIIDLFTNTVDFDENKFITIDVARFGKDKTVVMCWQGLFVYKIEIYEKQDLETTKEKIRKLAADEKVPYSRIIADESGVGGGLVDGLSGIKGFIGGSSAIVREGKQDIENYQNLRTQCFYVLAENITNHKIGIDCQDEKMKQDIAEELEQIKSVDPETEGKLKIIGKDEVKENIGRSPDYSDCLSMRMWFDIKGLEAIPNKRKTQLIRNDYGNRKSY